MCQVYGPAIRVGCSECGAGYYEDSKHTCKIFVSFEDWDADLQQRASEPDTDSDFMNSLQRATKAVAAFPEWKRKYFWAEENRHTVKVKNES